MSNGERLYVCGTNAHNPKDWVINDLLPPPAPNFALFATPLDLRELKEFEEFSGLFKFSNNFRCVIDEG
ncbi:hypothetical protein GWI33_009239 [Rhynchophorus ferrugineus]|uniref:Uncharacterized protein n=1 Tax=Rhynchophorus ferrugineus TaxID=354439 RepID=A0A834IH63_RHYFE|nr:hypothetical protein GWI33_009239 [Rhynchophorus ferrugineus]